MFSDHNQKLSEELLETIRFFSQKGWSPATSTNYSVRSEKSDQYIITRSGVDKSRIAFSDFILINPKGEILSPFNSMGLKSSAETGIHTAIYDMFPDINCVLHTHSVLGTVLSLKHLPEKQMVFEGYELQKGLEGNMTHEMQIVLPIVPNSQEIPEIMHSMKGRFDNTHGFLIAGHGLYTWGKNIAAAKRHIESYEFLFECEYAMRRLK